jgi:hypothetical protein
VPAVGLLFPRTKHFVPTTVASDYDNVSNTAAQLAGRVTMRKLVLTTVIVALAGTSLAVARGGGSHGHSMARGGLHGHSMRALSAPANPSVPPSLTSDPRLTGSAPLPSRHQMRRADLAAPLKPDPEDAKVDKMIKNICRGC